MAKTGIGALLFAIAFGFIFGISAYLFFSVISGLSAADLGIFAGLGLALGGILVIGSGIVGLISGIITIGLLIMAFDRMKSYRRKKNSKINKFLIRQINYHLVLNFFFFSNSILLHD